MKKFLCYSVFLLSFLVFIAGSAQAAYWYADCDIKGIQPREAGGHIMRCFCGSEGTLFFIIPSSHAEANALYATALTAVSLGNTLDIQVENYGDSSIKSFSMDAE